MPNIRYISSHFYSLEAKLLLKRKLFGVFLGVLISTSANAEMMDRVLVIVDDSIITQSEFGHRMKAVQADMKREADKQIPADINKQLLEGMITDRLQLQEAGRRGIEVSDAELQQALERFASQQGITVTDFAASLERQGQSFSHFEKSIRESLTLSRLTEYYARSRVVVPDYEIDGFIAQNNLAGSGVEYQIAHILIKDPTNSRATASRATANEVIQRLNDGLSFAEAALQYSDAADAKDGGMIGWRTLDRLPEVFRDGIQTVNAGGVTDVLESPNGLHILKLIDTKGDVQEIIQSKVRHILISSTSKVAVSQAIKKSLELRQRIVNGEDFSQMARIYSDDSVSAATGGELGWVSPGDMVPEFEKTFDQLAIGEISQPIETQYGVHILEVLDRRNKNITDQMIRARADNILRRQRAEREFQQWVRELREQAYIEYVSEPV